MSIEIENKSFYRLVTNYNPFGFILNLCTLKCKQIKLNNYRKAKVYFVYGMRYFPVTKKEIELMYGIFSGVTKY